MRFSRWTAARGPMSMGIFEPWTGACRPRLSASGRILKAFLVKSSVCGASTGRPWERHEARNPSRVQGRQRPLRLRGDLDHEVDEGPGAASRDLLQLPSLLHREAEAHRLRRPGGALHAQVRQEEGTGSPGVALPFSTPAPERPIRELPAPGFRV